MKWMWIGVGTIVAILAVLMITQRPRVIQTPCVEASRRMYERLRTEGKEPYYVVGRVEGSVVDHCVVGLKGDGGEVTIYDDTGVLGSGVRLPYAGFDVHYIARGKIKQVNGTIILEAEK